MGYFLSSIFSSSHHPRLWTLLSALIVSSCIEVLQFLTYRGMLDVDDLVSNVCGAALGLLIYRLCKADKQRRMVWIMLTAGFVGCIITAIPAAKSPVDVKVTKEFAFSISSVEVDNGKTVIEGECFLYDRKTLPYTILVGESETATTVDGQVLRRSSVWLGLMKSTTWLHSLMYRLVLTSPSSQQMPMQQVCLEYRHLLNRIVCLLFLKG